MYEFGLLPLGMTEYVAPEEIEIEAVPPLISAAPLTASVAIPLVGPSMTKPPDN
jgi:siroheme synthase